MHRDHLLVATALSHDMSMAVAAGDSEWVSDLVVLGITALAVVHRDLLCAAIALELGELAESRTGADGEPAAIPGDPHSGGVETVVGLAHRQGLGVVRVAD